MAIWYDAPVTPHDLTMFVRQVPSPDEFILNQILPDVTVASNRIDTTQFQKRRRVARFRAWGGAIHRAERDTGSIQSVELPPVSDSLAQGEMERLKRLFAETQGGNIELMGKAIYDDAQLVTEYIDNRVELARGDLLTDGKVTMLTAAGEPTLEADFSSSVLFYTAGTLWSVYASADPIANLTSYVKAYRAANGFNPGGMWMSQDVVQAMLLNTNLRTIGATQLGSPTMVNREILDRALSSFSLPPIAGIYDAQVDVDNVSTRIIPNDRIIFVPPAGRTVGRTVWGVSATALELVDSTETEFSITDAPGKVAVAVKEGPPFRQYVFGDAVCLPVLDDPQALMIAKVL